MCFAIWFLLSPCARLRRRRRRPLRVPSAGVSLPIHLLWFAFTPVFFGRSDRAHCQVDSSFRSPNKTCLAHIQAHCCWYFEERGPSSKIVVWRIWCGRCSSVAFLCFAKFLCLARGPGGIRPSAQARLHACQKHARGFRVVLARACPCKFGGCVLLVPCSSARRVPTFASPCCFQLARAASLCNVMRLGQVLIF